MLVESVRELVRTKSLSQDNLWLGILVPLALVLWGFLLPWLGTALGLTERKHLIQLLERVFLTRQIVEASVERQWRSSIESWLG